MSDDTDEDGPTDETLPELHAFQFDVLCTIAQYQAGRYFSEQPEGPYGLELKRTLEAAYETLYDRDNVEINHGRLYPALKALSHRGLIESDTVEGGKKVHRLTFKGERRVGAWARWFVPFASERERSDGFGTGKDYGENE